MMKRWTNLAVTEGSIYLVQRNIVKAFTQNPINLSLQKEISKQCQWEHAKFGKRGFLLPEERKINGRRESPVVGTGISEKEREKKRRGGTDPKYKSNLIKPESSPNIQQALGFVLLVFEQLRLVRK